MNTVTIRELHEKTDEWVQVAAQGGEVRVTDQGKTIARIVPESPIAETAAPAHSDVPYFARRRMSPEFAKYIASGEIRPGKDITEMISEDRDR